GRPHEREVVLATRRVDGDVVDGIAAARAGDREGEARRCRRAGGGDDVDGRAVIVRAERGGGDRHDRGAVAARRLRPCRGVAVGAGEVVDGEDERVGGGVATGRTVRCTQEERPGNEVDRP